ncbi:hypothetical protein AYI70_g8064 [Smittium culicis]|uniref:Magnesium transporter NIPA8 n=1 Tax=Smittium culicis TaxID=133412 RepID=A0A1R1XHN3_9FUNG|nr:hypothetical protein AYI70_g8064 [Smittium culicis]
MSVLAGLAISVIGNTLIGIGQCVQKQALAKVIPSTNNQASNSSPIPSPTSNERVSLLDNIAINSSFENGYPNPVASTSTNSHSNNNGLLAKSVGFFLSRKVWLFGLALSIFGEFLAITVSLSYLSTLMVVPLNALAVVSSIVYGSVTKTGTRITSKSKAGLLSICSGILFVLILLPRPLVFTSTKDLKTVLLESHIIWVFKIFYSIAALSIALEYLLTKKFSSTSITQSSLHSYLSRLSKDKRSILHLLICSLVISSLAASGLILAKIMSLQVSIDLAAPKSAQLTSPARDSSLFSDVLRAWIYPRLLAKIIRTVIPTFILHGLNEYNLVVAIMLTINMVIVEKYRQIVLANFPPLKLQVCYFTLFSIFCNVSDFIIFKQFAGSYEYFMLLIALSSSSYLIISGFLKIIASPTSPLLNNDDLPIHARDLQPPLPNKID